MDNRNQLQAANTSSVVQQDSSIQSVVSALNSQSVKNKFAEILGGQRAPAFISSIISAVSLNKTLKECPAHSVISSAAIAATLDLPINPSLGMAHIVPYRNKGVQVAQFQMGWKGFVQLAMRTGKYKTVNASIIHEGDIKAINRFTGDIEFNEKQIAEFEKRPIVGYLFYFRLINGFEKYLYMSKDECIEHGKKYSQSFKKGFGNWVDDFDNMALKTVTKQCLSKWGILSVEMQQAIVTDQAVVNEDGTVEEYPDNDISSATTITEGEPIVQTLRQQYETLKLQMQTAGKLKEFDTLIKGHSEESKRNEKTWNDADLQFLIKNMEEDLKK